MRRALIVGEEAPGSLLHSYRDGFADAGLAVETLCLRSAVGAAGAPSLATRVGRRLRPGPWLARLNAALLREAVRHEPDLVLVLKGSELSPETVAELRARVRAPVVNFYPDDPFTSERASRLAFGAAVLAAYDHCFTFARHLMPAYRAAGARSVHYLPFARDPRMHSPEAAVRAEPEFDVVFLGNIDEDRLPALEVASEFRLAVFGERTRAAVPSGSPLRRATFLPAQYGSAYATALARGAISLNVMRRQNRFSHNMRSFESPACGAFTLSQRTPELAELFVEGREMAFYGSPAELREQIAYWLNHDSERRQVAEAGFRRVKGDTYAVRARTILDACGLARRESA